MTVFHPRIDCLDQTVHVFEKSGTRNSGRSYRGIPLGTNGTGEHVHGDAADFLGLSPKSKYFASGNPAEENCAAPWFAEELIFNGSGARRSVPTSSTNGLTFAGSSAAVDLVEGAAGIRFAGSSAEVTEGFGGGALSFSGSSIAAGSNPGKAFAGIAFGGAATLPDIVGGSVGGLEFAGSGETVEAPPAPCIVFGGFSEGATVGSSIEGVEFGGTSEGATVGSSSAGVEFGGASEDMTSGSSSAGVEFGGASEDMTSGGSSAGVEFGGASA